MDTDKTALRRLIRQRKKEFTQEEKRSFSEKTCKKILFQPFWQEAKTVFLYAALPDELDTSLLAENALLSGKTVLFPVVVGNDLQIKEYNGETRTGEFGITEPIGPEFCALDAINLAIVPGIAFDVKGNRLGRGRGYYDRTLSRLPNALKIGVCFPFQVVEQIPFDEHDIKMDSVIYIEPDGETSPANKT